MKRLPDKTLLLEAERGEAPPPAPARPGLLARILRPLAARPPEGRGDFAARPRTARRPPLWLISFLLFVAAPSLAAQLYLAFVASDQFVSESRFAVRQVEQGGDSVSNLAGAASAAKAGGGGVLALDNASQDAHVVRSYLRSRAVVDDLSREVDLRALFRRPEADLWARLPDSATIDQLVAYWNSMVFAYVDGPSGIVTLQIRAFRPEDAYSLSQAALRLSERLVNAMADRARADALALAGEEVRRADAEWRAALDELRAFRDREGLIDPVKAADDTAKLIQGLLVEKIRLESDLAVAAAGRSPDAPGLAPQRTRLAALDGQIRELKAKLSGTGTAARDAAATLSRFEVIEIRRQFAEKLYALAHDGLNRARTAADRRRVYLTVFSPPAMAEESRYPRRIAYSLLIPAVLMVLWSIAGLTVLAVEDHRL